MVNLSHKAKFDIRSMKCDFFCYATREKELNELDGIKIFIPKDVEFLETPYPCHTVARTGSYSIMYDILLIILLPHSNYLIFFIYYFDHARPKVVEGV